jgi:predicted unusual protein kinase regulating ubiquinone biosynthesis (AarF/ABC1/UbiB family)
MGISLKPEHLKRYKDVAWLLVKYGRSDLVKHAGLEEVLTDRRTITTEVVPEAKALADDLERMGPTFVKLGQLLSTRADLFPLPYLQALTRLQDRVGPFPYQEVEAIVESEIGVPISKAFSAFDQASAAAASLGQVHHARLRDGRPVAVKVQRPGIRKLIVEDLEALMEIAEFLDNHTQLGERYELHKMLEEFRRSLFRELDYRQEAHNLTVLGENLKEFSRIVIPSPIEDFTTSRVLTMEYIHGRKITSFSPLASVEINGAELADQVFRAYLQQIFVDGFFHADPHPGNVFLTDDGRIALLDLGMVGHISPNLQERLLQLVLAITEGRAEDAATIVMRIGEKRQDFDREDFLSRFADLIIRHQDMNVGQIEVGTIVFEVAQIAGDAGIRLPTELTMLGKTLLNLDQVGRTLDPEFDPNASIRANAVHVTRRRVMKSASPGHIFSGLIEIKDLAERLPQRVNRILDRMADNEIEVKVNAIDEKSLMTGFQKIANRITLGLVLAALIVGAAMLMSVPTSFQILGYPALAIIFFLAAAGGGVALMLDILFYDEKSPKK